MTSCPLHRLPLHLSLGAMAALAVFAAPASAESQYGSGTGTITAQARVNLSITVPKMILLRVGSPGATVDTLSWNSALSVASAPTAPVDGNNQAANWDGTAPTASTAANPPGAVGVYAWTNAPGGGSLSYTASAFGAGGPTLGNITVTPATGLSHPVPLALATSSTAAVTFAATTVATGSWTYTLGGTPAGWQAGTYTSQVTYTATSL